MSNGGSLVLFFNNVNKTHEGNYTCVATSSSGKVELEYQVKIDEKPEDAEKKGT
jgi:hypothetical protein